MKRSPRSRQRRFADHEIPEDLRPVEEPAKLDSPDMIYERFRAFGGDPMQLNDAASIASAGLVIAEQVAELTTAIHTLSYLLCTTNEPPAKKP